MPSSPAPPHEIVIVPTDNDNSREKLRQQCYDVRVAVFQMEQGFPLDTEFDEFEDTATHILLRLTPNLEPVGTIRCVKKGSGKYKLTRLAVLKDYRQYGFGRLLVDALHAWVRSDAQASGLSSAAVLSHSQIPAKGFYARFGYQPEGDEFDEDGAPHQLMVLHITL